MMNNQEARIQVVLPDLLPLPSMITDVSKLSKNVNNMTINQANQPKVLKDEEFIQLFEQKKLNNKKINLFFFFSLILAGAILNSCVSSSSTSPKKATSKKSSKRFLPKWRNFTGRVFI